MCLGLGYTRAELLERMTADEFHWWARVWRAEPWGEPVADERLRYLCMVVANSAGGEKSTADFEFSWGKRASASAGREISFAEGMAALTKTFPTR